MAFRCKAFPIAHRGLTKGGDICRWLTEPWQCSRMTTSDITKLAALFLALNLIVFSVYFLDKQAARQGGWRISERTLLTLALIGGSLGAVAAQQILRHKTRKEPFRSILTAILILHGALATVLAFAPLWAPRLHLDF